MKSEVHWGDDSMNSALRKRTLIALALMTMVSACANPLTPVESDDMIAPGRGTDDYKLSPCACTEMKLAPLDRKSIEIMHEIYG